MTVDGASGMGNGKPFAYGRGHQILSFNQGLEKNFLCKVLREGDIFYTVLNDFKNNLVEQGRTFE